MLTDRQHFLLRRLHSICGIFPIGVFLIEHLVSNSFITDGPAAYTSYILFLWGMPFLPVVELGMIGIPLAFHSLYGVVIALAGRPNNLQYTYMRNWMYTLQRVTGFVAFAFIAWHVFTLRGFGIHSQYEAHEFYLVLQKTFQQPIMFAFYVIGLASTVFHFANGISTFLISWGITVSARSQRLAGYACLGLGLVLFFLGMNPMIHLVRTAVSHA